MGANSTQGLALTLFLIAFVLMAGAAAGGGILLLIAGLVVLVISCGLFLKAKPWEHSEG
ncbi:MAG: hypothetical protein ACRD9L_04405 [Bryobacteraceae bacterium]